MVLSVSRVPTPRIFKFTHWARVRIIQSLYIWRSSVSNFSNIVVHTFSWSSFHLTRIWYFRWQKFNFSFSFKNSNWLYTHPYLYLCNSLVLILVSVCLHLWSLSWTSSLLYLFAIRKLSLRIRAPLVPNSPWFKVLVSLIVGGVIDGCSITHFHLLLFQWLVVMFSPAILLTFS